ncbi:PREDICTED: uncharacterized protein LOC109383156 [Hipposideros armiger]|uniref:Uncharacterized protein LOC109383156 n=1 Tax=Hipposideros armiger TaxID=186990 RepID=A0A8B7RDK4_HIPAR|nr:PREDICTED: uncharacterized protein LOC109383156 [Hipposideros armiger]XP_019498853.1 PREDICTED: uncharacterized protein LOC109383156 [Hipposideros armiger]
MRCFNSKKIQCSQTRLLIQWLRELLREEANVTGLDKLLTEAPTERSLHYFKPHQTLGKSDVKNVVQVRCEAGLDLLAGAKDRQFGNSQGPKGGPWMPPVYSMSFRDKTKRTATKVVKYVGGPQKEDESWRVLGGCYGLTTHRIVALSCAPGLQASNLAQGRTSTGVSQLLVSPARALLENPSAAGNLGRALIGVLITGRSALPPFPQPLSRPPGPSSLFASSAWGSTRYSRTRLQARPGERSSLPAAGRARARSPARASRGHWACAARGRRWLGAAERASGRAHPDFIGCGGRGGVAERSVRAGLAREIAARRLGADSGAAARGGRGGRRPARSEAFPLATSCLVWARGASGETRGPEGGSEVTFNTALIGLK